MTEKWMELECALEILFEGDYRIDDATRDKFVTMDAVCKLAFNAGYSTGTYYCLLEAVAKYNGYEVTERRVGGRGKAMRVIVDTSW